MTADFNSTGNLLVPGTTQGAVTCTVGTEHQHQPCYWSAAAGEEYFTFRIGPFFVLGCAIFSVFWGTIAGLLVKGIDMSEKNYGGIEACIKKFAKDEKYYETNPDEKRQEPAEKVMQQLRLVGEKITEGAESFLYKEYLYLAIWSALFALVLGFTVDSLEMNDATAATNFPYTATSYLLGSLTSIVAGYIGMRIAVYTNTRVTFSCAHDKDDCHAGFIAAFRGGQVLGFVLVGLALLNLMIIVLIFKLAWYDAALDNLDQQFPGDIHDAQSNAPPKTRFYSADNFA